VIIRMMKHRAACLTSVLFALLVTGSLAGQASGPSPPYLPTFVLRRAALIAQATVQSISPSPGSVEPRQNVVFGLGTVIKGTPPPGNLVVITHPAGGGGAGAIPMQIGERYVLFLEPTRTIEIPPREGPPLYEPIGVVDNAIKVEGDKIVVNPAMPFHDAYNGKSLDEFLKDLRTRIEAEK
jgi:hypothetical protein